MIRVRTLVKSLHRRVKTPADLIADINSCASNQQERSADQYPEMADEAWRVEVFRLARSEGWEDFAFSGWAGLGFTPRPSCWQSFRVAKTGRHRLTSPIITSRRSAA